MSADQPRVREPKLIGLGTPGKGGTIRPFARLTPNASWCVAVVPSWPVTSSWTRNVSVWSGGEGPGRGGPVCLPPGVVALPGSASTTEEVQTATLVSSLFDAVTGTPLDP